tara:strand:+ start:1183 stop:2244 length:1062 start_codon:yes stop_codon:yes gene_type:complete
MSNTNYNQNDEVSLKDLITRIKDFFNEVIKYWWIVSAFCLVTTAGFLYNHSQHETEYVAKLRFVVEGQSSQAGGLRSLLGTFGIKRDGGLNPYKIINVGRSTDILIKVLNKSTKGSIVANEIIETYNLREEWTNKENDFTNYSFPNTLNLDAMSLDDKKVLRNFYSMLWGTEKNRDDCLSTIELDENTGIYLLQTKSLSEELSLDITNEIYDNITYFFETAVFENQLKSAKILELKADSIKQLRESKVMELARIGDSSRGLFTQMGKSKQTLLNQEVFALGAAYVEILKSYEMTDVNLKDMQPLFMVIDAPYSPLSASISSLLKSLIYGFVLGGFFAGIFIIIRKVYRDTMEA